jgi:peptide methionine sulfoxide reductase MsrB
MKPLLAIAVLFTAASIAAPHCVVIHNSICFESQGQYDSYMGWDANQQKLEKEANR